VRATPDEADRVELSRFLTPGADVSDGGPRDAPANAHGLRHLAFEVDDLDAVLATLGRLGYGPIRDVVRYEDVYRLCFVRGPEGLIAELAEPLAGS